MTALGDFSHFRPRANALDSSPLAIGRNERASRPARHRSHGWGGALSRIVAGAVRSALRSHVLWLLATYLGLLFLMAQVYA